MSERDYMPPLSYEGNIAENWREWRRLFELYIVATESEEKPDKTKIAKLLTIMVTEKCPEIQ